VHTKGKFMKRDGSMKGLWLCLVLGFLAFGWAKPAAAHQPRIGAGQGAEIQNPETSQAFYAELQGEPDEYIIRAGEGFHFHISLLVPDLPGSRRDFRAAVYDRGGGNPGLLLLELEGKGHDWQPFFEPFAGDRYYQGPETDRRLPPGVYAILVSNPGNQGKYVLGVGREERFSLAEGMETLRRLPAVKRYFGKSPLTAYFNLVGLFMLAVLLLLAAGAFLVYRLCRSFFFKGY
jgi:hypothetical protein